MRQKEGYMREIKQKMEKVEKTFYKQKKQTTIKKTSVRGANNEFGEYS